MTFDELSKLVEKAKENIDGEHPHIRGIVSEYMFDMEACYQAMLDVQDYRWRLDHQAELSTARNSLARLLRLDEQVVQEYYEQIAFRKLQFKES